MKLSEWRLKITENGNAVLNKLSMNGNKAANTFSSLENKASSFGSRLGNSFKGLTSQIPILGRIGSILSNPLGLVAGAALTAGVAMAKPISMAMDFDKGMAKINATAQLTRPELNKLRNTLIKMGQDSTAEIERIPDAYEKILSQTGDVALSTDILDKALKGAQAGFTDIDTVAGALAQTLSIVGKENTNAKEVLDTFFMAKKVGAGEFQDFATYMPQLIAAGRNLGLTYQTTAGLFSYMTGKGQNAADSAMLMQNAFTALSKGNITSGLEKNGIKIFNKEGTMRDIGSIFSDLSIKIKKFGKDDKALSNFYESIGLKDVQARNAFSILTGDATKLKETLGEVKMAGGETERQLDATANVSGEWAKTMNFIKGIGIEIGSAVLPVINKVFKWIGDGVRWVVDGIMDAYNNSELFRDLVWGIGKIFEGIGWVIKQIWQAFKSLGQLIEPIVHNISTGYSLSKALFSKDSAKAAQVIASDQQYRKEHQYDTEKNALKSIMDSGFATDAQKKIARMAYEKKFGALNPAEQSPDINSMFNASGSPDAGGLKGSDVNSSLSNGISGISEGGKSVKYVTVNITKLVESIVVQTTNMSTSANEIKRIAEEALLRAINGAELAQANGI